MPESIPPQATPPVAPWPELAVESEDDLSRRFDDLQAALTWQLAAARDESALRAARDHWLGRRKGVLAEVNERWLKAAPPQWKPQVGERLNRLRLQAETELAAVATRLSEAERLRRFERERADLTLPGRPVRAAALHPVLQTMDEIVAIFARLGYAVEEGPEIETDYYNFEALNIPAGHPARDAQDTIYLETTTAACLLRSHTSPVQVRAMERHPPPLRIVAPGRVYRRDAPDASHSPMFHQVEGLAVEAGLTFGDLKGTLDHFAQAMFGSSVRTRFRPSYFQFTEPSAEMDVSCIFCAGRGCRTCKASGWIELLGCGMVDPAVYAFAPGYDPERISGFAFGIGVERIAMVRYGVDDIQRFYSGDLRFLEQFR